MDSTRNWHMNEVSQTEMEKYCLTSLISNLKRNDSNELVTNQERDS